VNTIYPPRLRAALRPCSLAALAAAVAAAILMALPSPSFAGVFLSVDIAPPEIPVYEQPSIPGDGYIWTPGYWAYSDDGYFWVPGTWVEPPTVGVLWTPGYWGWDGAHYIYNEGYWGPHVGFYGGVDYGYGYGGFGYEGGYWNNGAFYYNTNVTVMGSVTVRNSYRRDVIDDRGVRRVGFNGGPGGLQARRSADEERAEHEQHIRPNEEQQRQSEMASHNRAAFASVNHGSPEIAATPKAGVFEGPGVVKAREGAPGERGAADAHGAARGNPEGSRVGSEGAHPGGAEPKAGDRQAMEGKHPDAAGHDPKGAPHPAASVGVSHGLLGAFSHGAFGIGGAIQTTRAVQPEPQPAPAAQPAPASTQDDSKKDDNQQQP